MFGPIPDFKPVSAIAIIAGATLGRRNGFMVGALAALTSNFFFGQGMWTPWQMYAWGLVGYIGGALAHAGAFGRADGTVRMPALLAYGFASGLLYGVVINAYDIIGFCSTAHVGGRHSASCYGGAVRHHAWPRDLRVLGRSVQALVSPHQPRRREIRAVGLVAPGRESILSKCHLKLCRFTGLDWHRQTIPAFFEIEQSVYLRFYYFGIALWLRVRDSARKPA